MTVWQKIASVLYEIIYGSRGVQELVNNWVSDWHSKGGGIEWARCNSWPCIIGGNVGTEPGIHLLEYVIYNLKDHHIFKKWIELIRVFLETYSDFPLADATAWSNISGMTGRICAWKPEYNGSQWQISHLNVEEKVESEPKNKKSKII